MATENFTAIPDADVVKLTAICNAAQAAKAVARNA